MKSAKVLMALFCASLMIATSLVCLAGVDVQTDDGLVEKDGCPASGDDSNGEAFWIDKLEYRVKSDTVKVIDYKGSKVCDLYVPDTVDYKGKTYVVDEIGNRALTSGSWFARYPSSVSIGPTIEKIGDGAMNYCGMHHHVNKFEIRTIEKSKLREIGEDAFRHTNIPSIELPASLEKIGKAAFFECNNMESCKRASVPGVSSAELKIGVSAFAYCEKLSNVDMEGKVIVGEYAFHHNPLKTVSMPDATYIDNDAFRDCSDLQTVNLPAAAFIGRHVFENCDSLTTADISKATTISDYAFYHCRNLNNIDMQSAVTIGKCAFEGDALKEVNISSATTIGDHAFRKCHNLTTVNMKSVTTIGIHAFHDCNNLTTVDMQSVVTIGKCAFEGCKNLGAVNIPKAVTLGDYAFKNCDSLQTVDMPEVVHIGEYAFESCDSLHVVIMYKVTDIGDMAFNSCKQMTKIVFSPCLEKIGPWTFASTKFYDASGQLMQDKAELFRGHTFEGQNSKLHII